MHNAVFFLKRIKDHRRRQGLRYEQAHILLFSITAILSGADSYRKIHLFIATHYGELDEQFDLNWQKTPAHTTVRDIILRTSAEELEREFREHSVNLTEYQGGNKFINLDGKVLRGSFDHFNDQKAVQVLSALAGGVDIIPAHEEIAEKSNEIPAARKLMKELGLSNRIFTFDALHCQEKTLRTAAETGNDVIVQVKKNQKTLLNDCETVSKTAVPHDIFQEPVEKTRNRIESRKAEVFIFPILTNKEKWNSVEAVIKVDRFRQVLDTKSKKWKDTHEVSFYISTVILNAQKTCRGIRGHWHIENKNHHVRDVSMGEDRSRIRKNAHVFAKLRSFALNILRANKVENVSAELFKNCMNIDHLFNYLGIF